MAKMNFSCVSCGTVGRLPYRSKVCPNCSYDSISELDAEEYAAACKQRGLEEEHGNIAEIANAPWLKPQPHYTRLVTGRIQTKVPNPGMVPRSYPDEKGFSEEQTSAKADETEVTDVPQTPRHPGFE